MVSVFSDAFSNYESKESGYKFELYFEELVQETALDEGRDVEEVRAEFTEKKYDYVWLYTHDTGEPFPDFSSPDDEKIEASVAALLEKVRNTD